MNQTPIQQKLDSDFAALFGPVTPPASPGANDGTKTSERFDIA